MKLTVDDLKQECNPELFDFNTTEEIDPFEEGIIGQQRAVDAVELGLRVKQDGYNIFISGITGTGKTTYAKTIANQKAKDMEIPSDLCYVYNFKEERDLLVDGEAAFIVENEDEFRQVVNQLFSRPELMIIVGERAADLVSRNRGAVKKHVKLLQNLLQNKELNNYV